MKPSPTLLVAWFVVIAGLVGAVFYFALRSSGSSPPSPAPSAVDPRTKPLPGTRDRRSTRTERQPRDRLNQDEENAPRRLRITGTVRDGTGAVAADAHVAIFRGAPLTTALRQGGPVMDDIRFISQTISLPTDEWDAPRPLASWFDEGGGSATAPLDHEITGVATDASGAFTIYVPPADGEGPFRLLALKEGVGAASVQDARPGQNYDLLLTASAKLVGTVVTDVNSLPVQGAKVVLDDGVHRMAALSGEGGKFEFDAVAAGVYRLLVAAKDRTPLIEQRYQVLAVEQRNPVTLRLPRGTILMVKATVERTDPANQKAAASQPVANAEIVALHEDTYAYLRGRTDQNGMLQFPNVPAGSWLLNGTAEGLVSQGEQHVKVKGTDTTQDAEVLFEPAVLTTVEVVDEEQRPLAGVEFYCGNADEKYDSLRSLQVGTTGSDGKIEFAFEFDPPRNVLFGFKKGYAMVHACPDDNTSGEPIRLVAKKPVSIHGSVRTRDGKGVPDATVSIDLSGDADDFSEDAGVDVLTDKDGNWSFPYLPRAASVYVTASSPDGVAEEGEDLELVADKSDYTVDIVMDLDERVVAPPVTPPSPLNPRPQLPPRDR